MMLTRWRIAVGTGMVVLFATCATGPQPARRASYSRSALSLEEISGGSYRNMYDVVVSLRHEWISGPRAGSGMGVAVSAVPVLYIDGYSIGPIDLLRTISTDAVERACYHSPTSAQARFGLSANAPVIELFSRGRTSGPVC